MGLIRAIKDKTHYIFFDEFGVRKEPFVIEMDLYNQIIMHFMEKIFGKKKKEEEKEEWWSPKELNE